MQNQFLKGNLLPISFLLKCLLIFGFLVLTARLIELQVIKGSYYRELADNNRVRIVPITAARGRILARGGETIADNKIIKKNVEFDPNGGFLKKRIQSNINDYIEEPERFYPEASSSAQITGYLGETTEGKIGKVNPLCPSKGVSRLNQLEGKSGIEEAYDCDLRGVDGEELVEVDINGQKLRTIGRKKPVEGSDVQTTIDFALQRKVVTAMNGKIGAVVATDSKGQILSLFSSPSFDPNLFVNETNSSKLTSLLTDKSLPLFNRVISGAYHPGSIFKLIVGAAALSDASITKDSTFKDTGVLSVNGFDYSSWYFTQYGRIEGEQTFAQALSRSTDTFFYKVGEREGIDRLVYWAEKFGIGKKTGVDISGEVSGILPSPSWKEKTLGERWYLGNTFHFSIGQGDLLVTPLQANIWTSIFANGGLYCKPYLSLTDKKSSCEKVDIQSGVLLEVKRGMEMACETGGTAYPFFDFTPKVACKTGTAETGTKGNTHAWFTVMAPAQNPEIVLTVLVENGGEGSAVAAPIAKEVLNYWFHERSQ